MQFLVCPGFIDQWIFTTFPNQAWIQYDLFNAKVGRLVMHTWDC